jgi:hypothetical protein
MAFRAAAKWVVSPVPLFTCSIHLLQNLRSSQRNATTAQAPTGPAVAAPHWPLAAALAAC